MALTTAALAAASRLITAQFDKSIRAASPLYPQIAHVVRSTNAEEKYAFLGDMPAVREWIGDRLFSQLRAADYELVNKHWESSLLVSKNDVADARILKYGMLIDQLAAEASYHPDELLFQVMIAGDTSGLASDGQLFFDTDHAWGSSGSQSNDLTYAAASGTTPTSAEFRAAYNQAYAAMIGFLGDNGKPLFRPTQAQQIGGPLVFVPPVLYPTALEALTARFDTNGNPVVIMGNPTVMSIAYLSTATEFYVVDPTGPIKPFIFQEREPLSRQVKGTEDLETKDLKLMTEARYNAGYGAWWKAVMTTFT
jgi:phage major head subunit gpT-like protein